MTPIGYLVRETMLAELDGLEEQDWTGFLDGRHTSPMQRAVAAVLADDELRKEETPRVPKKQARRRKNVA